MEIATCALCQKQAELCRSHLIPKGFYKAIADEKGNILKISGGKATIPPGMGQITTPLLCRHCENHFSKVEKIIINEGFHGSKFPLFDKVNDAKHKHQFGKSPCDFMIFADENSDIDWNSYVFFALSVFWRCSVVRNVKDVYSYHNAFGKYQDEIRNMLLSDHFLLPNYMYFVIHVNNDKSIPLISLTIPSVKTCSGYHIHQFTVPNVAFHLFVGKHIHESIMELRKIHGPVSIISSAITDWKYGKNICMKILNNTPYGRAKIIM